MGDGGGELLLAQWFSLRLSLPSLLQDIWLHVEIFLLYLGWDSVEARDAARRPIMHKACPNNNELSGH